MASIYILGAGAMGSLWATHLHLAFNSPSVKDSPKHSIHFLSTRTNAPKQIRFSLKSPFFLAHQNTDSVDFDIELPVINFQELRTASQDQPNIILLCTKSYHALDAVLQFQPYFNKYCYLVLFQNGLGSQHKIIDTFPNLPIYAAVSTEGVNRQADGKLIHAGKGLTRIGPLNDRAKDTTNLKNCISALTHQGLDTEATQNIWQALWEKLAINCAINPFTAILNCPNGEIRCSELFQENWPLLKLELTQMLNTAGIELTRTELEKRVFQVIENTKSNISSMLQDVRAKRKTEIEDINGFAAGYLEDKGLANRVNRM